MSMILPAALIGLLTISLLGQRFVHLPKNVWLLFLAQPLGMSTSSIIVFAGGLVATKIAPKPEFATLPLTLMILGTASAVIPASLLMKKIGRRKGTACGLTLAVFGALLSAAATQWSEFYLLIAGAILLGCSMAFVAQMRFAAIESLSDIKDSPKAISVLMIGGMFAAIIGPEAAVVGKDWIESPHGYTGSFLLLAGLLVVAIAIVLNLNSIETAEKHVDGETRSLRVIVRQPIFLVAVCAGAIAYSVMSYIMTATPLSMHEIDGHSLQDTKWVVQSHIIAMYLPSLFSAVIIRYLGLAKLMVVGSIIYISVIVIGFMGNHFLHYWWVMVLLGIGWNFLFTSGTLLLPESYRPSERFKTQALNDFTIFFVQALASLSAGMVIFGFGWYKLLLIALPAIIAMLLLSFWYWLRKD